MTCKWVNHQGRLYIELEGLVPLRHVTLCLSELNGSYITPSVNM